MNSQGSTCTRNFFFLYAIFVRENYYEEEKNNVPVATKTVVVAAFLTDTTPPRWDGTQSLIAEAF
jgi:hypothetical protein